MNDIAKNAEGIKPFGDPNGAAKLGTVERTLKELNEKWPTPLFSSVAHNNCLKGTALPRAPQWMRKRPEGLRLPTWQKLDDPTRPPKH